MASVYFLVMRDPSDPDRDFGMVKVGITEGDVVDRVAQLQTGNPFQLRCFGVVATPYAGEVEHLMHRSHAQQMQQLEWLRCPRDALGSLVAEAERVARRIEVRKAREIEIAARPSSETERGPSQEELALHRRAREVTKLLVPAELRLKFASATLRGMTGRALGIEGVVRVEYIGARTRFSLAAAEAGFPELVARHRVARMTGSFRWRGIKRPTDFLPEKLAADEATEKEAASTAGALAAGGKLEPVVARSEEVERLHDDFLRETQAVMRLRADLADLQSELTVRLGDDEAIRRVCSFTRRPKPEVDIDAFRVAHPEEARQCVEAVAPQIRKYVYPSRAYL